jgi:GDP-4-dehydro-6-deoxy-D-mannose reductase
LITGITGFAGGHLALELQNNGDEVYGVARDEGQGLSHLPRPVKSVQLLDISDPAVVRRVLEEIKPEAIYHLAAQAFVPTAWKDPWATMENNIRPQLNILTTINDLKLSCRLLVVASNEVYGKVQPDELPVNENAPFRPDNPYGVSKVAQDLLAYQYYLSHNVPVIRVRAFNHIGPRQSPMFVASSLAKQIAEIEAGHLPPVVHVGNLTAQRDFTDVKDVMHAYALLMLKGQAGEAYNVGSGVAHSIQELLDILLSLSLMDIRVEQDETRLRPTDNPVIYADNRKLKAATGWGPTIAFLDSVQRVLEYWRMQMMKK